MKKPLTKEDQNLELEANYFAICLLMPKDMLINDAKDIEFDYEGMEVKKLAKRYEVPANIMALRLYELGIIGL